MSSKREGSFRPAAPLVFNLRSEVNMQGPLQHLCLLGPLYSLTESECKVVNPFQADCDFSIALLHCSSDALMAAQKPADGPETLRCHDLCLLAHPRRIAMSLFHHRLPKRGVRLMCSSFRSQRRTNRRAAGACARPTGGLQAGAVRVRACLKL